jgi:type I restriction enzyme S subunit
MNLNSMLPRTWTQSDLSTLCATVHYGYTASSLSDPVGPRFLRITDIQNGQVNWRALPYCEIHEEEMAKYVLQEGDILFARTGGTVGKSFLVKGSIPVSVFASYLIRLVPHPQINPSYIYWYFHSHYYWAQIGLNKAGLKTNINASKLSRLQIPVSPLPEQHRIVEKIEELLSELDKGVESLRTAREQLKVYRQAVLKHAFEGKLTEKWRKEHASELEPAEILLEKIKAEREQRYQQQPDDWRQAAKALESGSEKSKRPTKPTKPKELPPLTEAELAELPERWIWVRAGDVFDTINNGYTPESRFLSQQSGEIPFIKVYNLNFDGTLNFGKEPTFVPRHIHQGGLKRSITYPGDVLINIVGPPLGKVSVVPSDFSEWNINQAIVLFRPNNYLSTGFTNYYLQNPVTIRWLEGTSKATAGQFNVKVSTCRMMPFPFCSTLEQHQIVQEIESRLSIAGQMERTIDDSLQKAEALRLSILKKAFEGRLVPQDPNDEPASVLLERIKAEKAKQKEKQGKTKK